MKKTRSGALTHLKNKLTRYVEGPDGIARDVIERISQFADDYPNETNRTLFFLGRTRRFVSVF